MDTVYKLVVDRFNERTKEYRKMTWDTFHTQEEAIAEAFHVCNKLQDDVTVIEVVQNDTGCEDDKGYPIIDEVEENPVYELYFNQDEQKPLRP